MKPAIGSSVRLGPRPGDLGAIAALHGTEYAEQYGLNVVFEAGIAAGLARWALDGAPGALYVTDDDGGVSGAIAVTDEGQGTGRVRWFLVGQAYRGRGLGRALFAAAMAEIAARDYRLVTLSTFSELTEAAHLYRAAAFEVVATEVEERWGRALLMQHYELRR
jgi:ribosomal protein S18 acetylase RimI-like enzyme